jgi:capping protein alpha
MTQDQLVSDTEKARIATHLIQEAPPGEFNEVWNDIRILLGDDNLMANCTSAAAQYNKDQLLAVQYDGSHPKVKYSVYSSLIFESRPC